MTAYKTVSKDLKNLPQSWRQYLHLLIWQETNRPESDSVHWNCTQNIVQSLSVTTLMLLIKPSHQGDLLISHFVLCLNWASFLELCLFQYFCLTLSKFLRLSDTISSVFVFIFLFCCILFPVFVFLDYLLFPVFALFYYLSLVRKLIFPVLAISFQFTFSICDMPFLLPITHNSFAPSASPNKLQDRFMTNVTGRLKSPERWPIFIRIHLLDFNWKAEGNRII